MAMGGFALIIHLHNGNSVASVILYIKQQNNIKTRINKEIVTYPLL